MKQAQFEQAYAALWQEFRDQLMTLEDRSLRIRKAKSAPAPMRFITLYRMVCRHLAVSEARGYSPALSQELHTLVLRGHQQLSRRNTPLHLRIYRFLWHDFPAAVRAEWRLFWAVSLLFYGSTLALGLAVYFQPSLGYVVLGESTLSNYADMYDPAHRVVGTFREADDDLSMFAFYIANNIGVGFRTFATGLFFGVGSLFSTVYNGIHGGTVGGYLTQIGYSDTFYTFICGHAPWELTAIIISAVAGCRVGFSLIAPGQRLRRDALVQAGKRAATLMWGVVTMLIVAAFFEAFWSSHADQPAHIKYLVSALNTLFVTFYFLRMGRVDETH